MSAVTLRSPRRSDAPALHALTDGTGVLDLNSPYAYILVCDHWAETSVVAELDGVVVGFVSAYRLPAEPTTLFVWQVGVDEKARGHGVATRMVLDVVRRPAAPRIRHLLTTVTPDNGPSTALFHGIARRLGADLTHPDTYGVELFPGSADAHEPERHFRIGPIPEAPHAAL